MLWLTLTALAQPEAPPVDLKPGWARVLVAAHPLQPGDVVRKSDVYAVQVDPKYLWTEQPPTPGTVVGREVVAPIFRNELIRPETLGEPKQDPQASAPSRTYLLALPGAAPSDPLAVLVSGGCTVAEVKVIQSEPLVVAVPGDALAAVLTVIDAEDLQIGPRPGAPAPCE